MHENSLKTSLAPESEGIERFPKNLKKILSETLPKPLSDYILPVGFSFQKKRR